MDKVKQSVMDDIVTDAWLSAGQKLGIEPNDQFRLVFFAYLEDMLHHRDVVYCDYEDCEKDHQAKHI